MITEIRIERYASYQGDPVVISGLACRNYFFGTNGSGKSTIARVIDGDVSVPQTCYVAWKNQPLKTMVYNRDFVKRNFGDQDLKGVFTLGKEDVEAVERIRTAKGEVDTCDINLTNQRQALADKMKEVDDLTSQLTETCWKAEGEYAETFADAFTGTRNNKVKFRERVLAERCSTAQLRELDDLKSDARTLFGEEPVKEDSVLSLDFRILLEAETDAILQTKIVGKEDVDIAALIRTLENDDWVSRGRDYLAQSEGLCPFCQKPVADGLRQSLDEFFDATYLSQKAELTTLVQAYETAAAEVTRVTKEVVEAQHHHMDVPELKRLRDILAAELDANCRILKEKVREPSATATLRPIGDVTAKMTALVATANEAIKNHNKMVDDYHGNKSRLINEVWKYLTAVDLKDALSSYNTALARLTSAKTSIEACIRETEEKRQSLLDEIAGLSQKNTTILPTKNAINGLLASLGFRGFHLDVTEDERGYVLKREDGTLVEDTLSEGERSFVTFLYFYNLLRGSHEDDGNPEDTVVVFDDPVSSLDSGVLFVVSTLIRRICDEAGAGEGHIKQAFVLTHNIQFHKEVTHEGRGTKGSRSYWLVRKPEGLTSVERRAANPVKTAYHLLWEEVRRTDRSAVTVQNAMRRILEHYFKTLGGEKSLDDLLECFHGEEQIVCKSLISWVHDGSHEIHDDLYLCEDDDCVEMYLRVFKSVFYQRNQQGHYDMMWTESGKSLGIEDGDGVDVEVVASA